MSQITVRSGPNSASIPADQSVAEIRNAFEGAFNIDPSAQARLNGVAVDEDQVISGGTVTFRTPVGEKGA